jgi:hypothetical protein
VIAFNNLHILIYTNDSGCNNAMQITDVLILKTLEVTINAIRANWK